MPAADEHRPVPDDPRSYLPGGDPRQIDEPGILAYFADRGDAEAARQALDAAGLGPVSLATFHPQSVDRANLDQKPVLRLDIQNTVDADIPLDRNTQATTLVAIGATGDAARRALQILRAHGGQV